MRPRTGATPSPSLASVRRRFERWRREPKADRRIPEALWAAAVEAAVVYGVTGTAQTLRLNAQVLKHRLEAAGSPGSVLPRSAASFVELLPPAVGAIGECVMELEDKRGTMRVQLRGAGAPDFIALARTFWRSEG